MLTTLRQLDPYLGAIRRDLRDYAQRRDVADAPATRSPLALAAEVGVALDPWQRDALTSDRHHLLLCVTRQGGKGLVASLLALAEMLNVPGSKTLVVSKTGDQANRLLSRIKSGYLSLAGVPKLVTNRSDDLGLITGSRAIAVPGSEQTIRGIDAVDLLVIDEAALVPDDLYAAVRPMLATTDGRQVALSTPRGKRGWFYRAWGSDSPEWHRVRVTADQIPRIKDSFLARELRDLGDFIFNQEYLCEFMDDVSQLYPTDLIQAALSSDVSPLGLPTFLGAAI
jgi:hypothetical protein